MGTIFYCFALVILVVGYIMHRVVSTESKTCCCVIAVSAFEILSLRGAENIMSSGVKQTPRNGRSVFTCHAVVLYHLLPLSLILVVAKE